MSTDEYRKLWVKWLDTLDRAAIDRHLDERMPFLRFLREAALSLTGEKPLRSVELGCGTGIDSAWLATQDRRVEAWVSDLVPEAIALAGKIAKMMGVKVEGVVADAQRTGFDDHSFDLVFHHGLLEHFREPSALIDESRRLVRPGGFLAVAVPQKFSPYTLFKRWKMRRGTWAHGWETEYSAGELLDQLTSPEFWPVVVTGYDCFGASVVRALCARLLGSGRVAEVGSGILTLPFSLFQLIAPDWLKAKVLKNLVVVIRRIESDDSMHARVTQ
jgi:SAM-dependent methyltransferase